MNSRSLLLVLALAGAGLLRAQVAAPDSLDALRKNSPFGQRATDGAAATPGATLELRGVIVDGGEVLFSVFDPTSRVSRWVGLNEAGNPFTVRSYDTAKSEVKVNYQGRELVLKLKQATIIALAAPPVPLPGTGPVPLPSQGTGPQPAAGIGASNDEAVRLAQIAEEIGRRRALRMQARPQANPAQPSPPPPTK